MVRLAGFSVEMIVDGQPAQEFDDDDEDEFNEHDSENSITKYVEAISGKDYHFAVKVDPFHKWGKADAIVVRPTVDGTRRLGRVLRKSVYQNAPTRTSIMEGEFSGTGQDAKLHRFVFADLQTRDTEATDATSSMKEMYGQLGLITIKLSHEQEISSYEADSTLDYKIDALKAVPEKALKGQALDVATTFKAEPAKRIPMTNTKALDKGPFLTFNFKYRTKKALQSLMILERSPTPVPLEERDPDELTREELAELVRRQRANIAIKSEHGTLKRERAVTYTTPKPPLKTSKGENGQTVIHVDSDDENEDDDGVQTIDKPNGSAGRRGSTGDEEIEIVTLRD